MDHFKRFKRHLALNTLLAIVLPGLAGIGLYVWLREILELDLALAASGAVLLYVCAALLSYAGLMKSSTGPLKMVWQAIWHVSPGKSDVPPPKLDEIKVKTARELVSAMVMQVYDLASSKPLIADPQGAEPVQAQAATAPADSGSLLESIPLMLFILDKDWSIKTANQRAVEYIGLSRENVVGKSIYDVLHLSFKEGQDSLDSWLKSVKNTKAIDSRSWEQVRLTSQDNAVKQFDLAASYSQDNPNGNEVVLALFDRSGSYDTEQQATAYIATAVHELRTPLTTLRGYVEMFEEELAPTLEPEYQEYIRKMSASAQSLSAFVGNILNVARIDENALVLKLQEADWKETLTEIVKDLELRAQVRNKRLTTEIADGLPAVAIDKISISEVVGNLVENAIKYSGPSPDIIVRASIGKDNLVETTVEDHGVGIPDSVIGGLFTRYYRSHRSKNAVPGTGLGLYLVKSIVNAHGGNVWVNSREGEGSRFSFTLQAWDSIKDQDKGPDGLERQAGGWIKNHSMYRR